VMHRLQRYAQPLLHSASQHEGMMVMEKAADERRHQLGQETVHMPEREDRNSRCAGKRKETMDVPRKARDSERGSGFKLQLRETQHTSKAADFHDQAITPRPSLRENMLGSLQVGLEAAVLCAFTKQPATSSLKVPRISRLPT